MRDEAHLRSSGLPGFVGSGIPGAGFVGRDAELVSLQQAASDAAAGRGSLWLVAGEPGVGKTRLVEEAERLARADGMLSAWGCCWESGGAPAFWPWTQVVRALQRPAERLGIGPPALLTEILTGQAGPSHDAVAGRFALFDSLASWLGTLAEVQPLWIGLEDLHAADPASLSLLEALLAPLRTSRMSIVGTLRDSVLDGSGDWSLGSFAAKPPRTSTHGRITRQARVLQLVRLDRADARDLLLQTLGEADDELMDAAVAATDGLPLFLVELARLARGGAREHLHDLIPASVHNVLRQRLEGMSPSTLQVLVRAALVGMDIGGDLLLRFVDETTAEAALAEAVSGSLLRRVGPNAWRFSHDVLRDVLGGLLTPTEREAAHREIALALSSAGASPAELAHHFYRAGPEQRALALREGLRAAQSSLARYAFEDAIAHAELAREHISAPSEERARFEVVEGLACIGLGRVDEGLAQCLSAAELARSLGAPEALAEAALAYGSVFRFANVDAQLVGLLELSLQALPPGDSPLRAQLLARLAAAQQPDPIPGRPIQLAREAIAMADRTGDLDARVAALRAGCSTMVDLEVPTDRRALDQRHLDLALQIGLHTDVLTARQRLAFDCVELGDFAAAQMHLNQAIQLAETTAHPRFKWRAPALRALTQLWHGTLETTRELIEEAHAVGEACGDPNARTCHAFQLGRWVELTGDMAELERATEELDRAMVGSALGARFSALARARLLLQLGDTESGLAAASREDVLAILAVGDRTMAHAAALWASAAGDEEVARLLLARWEKQAGLFVTDGVLGSCWRTPVELVLAHAAAASRDFAGGLRWAARAAEAAGRHDGGPAAAEAHLLGASLAARLGDEEQVAHHAARARTWIESLGLEGLRRALRRLDGPGAPQPRSADRSTTRSSAPPEPQDVPSFVDEGDVYCVTWGARSVRLQTTKGLTVLARLVAHPGSPQHVLDLVHVDGASELLDRGSGGDLLDEAARSAYRQRAATLREELDDAEARQDLGRVQAVRAELEFLAHELGRATGLGGRTRRIPDNEERARQAVRKQIRTGLDRIRDVHPELARYLGRAVKTGRVCVFEP